MVGISSMVSEVLPLSGLDEIWLLVLLTDGYV